MLKNFIYIIKKKILCLYDWLTAKTVSCSVGDLMLLRSCIYQNQFIAISRVCDIKSYIKYGDSNFPYQTGISLAEYGDNYRDGKMSMVRFARLIDSYIENGYKTDSILLVDKLFRLCDGTHRVACNYYFGIEEIRVRITQRVVSYKYGVDLYLECGLPRELLKVILNECNDIQKKLVSRGDCFCCLMSNVDFLCYLDCMVNILKKEYVSFSKDTMLIDKYFVKKNTYCFIKFSLLDPEYKVVGNELVSKRAMYIKKILKTNGLEDVVVSMSCLEGYKICKEIRMIV